VNPSLSEDRNAPDYRINVTIQSAWGIGESSVNPPPGRTPAAAFSISLKDEIKVTSYGTLEKSFGLIRETRQTD
jgi:hypothetical protein